MLLVAVSQLLPVFYLASTVATNTSLDDGYHDGDDVVCQGEMSECTSVFPMEASSWNVIQLLRETYEDYPITCAQSKFLSLYNLLGKVNIDDVKHK